MRLSGGKEFQEKEKSSPLRTFKSLRKKKFFLTAIFFHLFHVGYIILKLLEIYTFANINIHKYKARKCVKF